MIRLALLRHGHTDWNRMGRIQGASDIPLDDDARAELSTLRLPAPWDTAELWSSPLKRAAETAELVARHAPRTAPELSEMNWGTWEGKRGLDLLATPGSGFRHIEDWGWEYHAPGGESPGELWTRLRPWLARLERDALVVCHIGIMRVMLARAHGWNFSGPAPFKVKRNRLYVLHIDGDTLTPEGEAIRLIPPDATP
ncbi:histidine phosphatase family protein [Antarcticimicrobium sediminis]|uniref:Histidine phosphatase family protein n=1 Tax=Antarcticimicrobium sediminis TaxID=2546227 RepID=A0A4R5EVY8_9RHOB|nr:histidine phosphatase family protein [Antarcticimicrobium sediminis]TDE39071.1 histidine phosphatase family protein [Antarcticimicrobium sediminis]